MTTVPVPFMKTCKPYTPSQFGDRPELSARAEREALTQANRMRRWWHAYTIHCHAYGIPLGTVWVPCAVCGHEVNAWRADVDHVLGREKGSHLNVMLTHATCNRDSKADGPAGVRQIIALRRGIPGASYVRVTGANAPFRYFWNGGDVTTRRQGNGDDYVA